MLSSIPVKLKYENDSINKVNFVLEDGNKQYYLQRNQ